MTSSALRKGRLNLNPLAHKDERVRLLNSLLLFGLVHIGLFFFGNDHATPLRLLLSFTICCALLAVVTSLRIHLRQGRGTTRTTGATP